MKKFKDFVFDTFFIVLGAAVYAVSFVCFINPKQISPGGIMGIAAVINHSVPVLPTGVIIVVINIPVIILGFLKIGGKFIFKTFLVTILSSAFIDVFAKVLPVYKGERLVAAIFGGVMIGMALASIMLRGASTGGTDVLAKVARIKFPYLSMGRLVFILDGAVIIIASAVYRDFETLLYSAVYLVVQSFVLDNVLYGSDKGRLLFIVTNNSEEVSKALFKTINRGVTVISAVGGYEKSERSILLCAMRVQEIEKAVKTVKETDEEAFSVVTATGGIFGRGFEKKHYV